MNLQEKLRRVLRGATLEVYRAPDRDPRSCAFPGVYIAVSDRSEAIFIGSRDDLEDREILLLASEARPDILLILRSEARAFEHRSANLSDILPYLICFVREGHLVFVDRRVDRSGLYMTYLVPRAQVPTCLYDPWEFAKPLLVGQPPKLASPYRK